MLDTIQDVSLNVCDDLKTMNTHLKVRVCSSEKTINWQNNLDDFLIRSNPLLDEMGDQETMNFNMKSLHGGQIQDILFIKRTLDSCERSLNIVMDLFQLMFELFKMTMPQNNHVALTCACCKLKLNPGDTFMSEYVGYDEFFFHMDCAKKLEIDIK